MTTIDQILLVLLSLCLAAFACCVVFICIAYRQIAAEVREPAAAAAAGRETAPGGATADLADCWAIWPDAPLAEDGTR